MAKLIMSKVKASETEQSIQEAHMEAPCCRDGLEQMTAWVVIWQEG